MSHTSESSRLVLAASLLLAGCSSTDEASENAVLSKAPGSPGSPVFDLADGLFAVFGTRVATSGISMASRSDDGKEAVAGRLASGSAHPYPPRITVHLDPAPAGIKPRR